MRGGCSETTGLCSAPPWPCRMFVDELVSAECTGKAGGSRERTGHSADVPICSAPNVSGGQRRRATRRGAHRRADGLRDRVLQDQLLAESEAAIPAEMVRAVQGAAVSGGPGFPLPRGRAGNRARRAQKTPTHSRTGDKAMSYK